MKKRRIIRDIILILTIIGCLIAYFTILPKEKLIKNTKVTVEPGNWKPTISNVVNKSIIIANVDTKQLKSNMNGIYMEDNMTLMIPLDSVRDAFDCAVNKYDTYVLVEKGNTKLKMSIETGEYTIDEKEYYQDYVTSQKDNNFFCSVNVLCEAFSYSYSFDMINNIATIVNEKPEERTLPYVYNYEWIDKVPAVQNQGSLGTCWAFASLTALETTLMPAEKPIFSVDHMTLSNSFSLGQNDGGDYTMSMAYLLAWQGPVYDEDDPYGDNYSDSTLEAVKHVQEIQLLDSKDLEMIKKMVFKYGGVQSSFYCGDLTGGMGEGPYYNSETYGYCYIGAEKPNHEIVIIGWDDNYSRKNFNLPIEGDGAFICRNSWGSNFGNDGNFYISYYDSNIGVHNTVYTKVEDVDNYDHIYQTDLCGYVGELGYFDNSAYFANAYVSNGAENIEAVGFYATGRDTEYSIYVIENFQDAGSLSKRSDPIMTGKFTNAGFYTVKLDTPIQVAAGQKYAIIVRVTTPNAERPIAVEYASDYYTRDVIISDGEGYVSSKGITWERTEETQNCNVCLKVYTKDASVIEQPGDGTMTY